MRKNVTNVNDLLHYFPCTIVMYDNRSDTTDILYKLLVDQDSRVLLEKLPALLAMSYNKFSLGNHVAQHDKDVQSEISSVSITTTAYILGSTVVGIPSSHPGLDSRFPPKRYDMTDCFHEDITQFNCSIALLYMYDKYTCTIPSQGSDAVVGVSRLLLPSMFFGSSNQNTKLYRSTHFRGTST